MLAVIIIAQADRFVSLVEWGITLFSLLVLLPGLYVYLRLRLSRNYTNLQYRPMDFLKQHPKDILILGVICAVPCWAILKFLEAPPLLLITLITLLVTAMVIALVNLYYRASFHLAGITVLLYITIATWGHWFLFLVLIIPPTAWAKHRLQHHTIVQMLLGIAIGLALTPMILYWLR
jgi:hypothetical protein